jgi:Lon protease-like protein
MRLLATFLLPTARRLPVCPSILQPMPRELPIFPLPLVLFPGASQPLHIFEPRYRRLLADCLEADRRFGIAFAAADPERPEWDPVPDPGAVGCVARINLAHPLPDGRSHILTEGERRFVLQEWVERDLPYRVARVEEFDDEPVDPAEVATLAALVRTQFGRLVKALGTMTDGDQPALPADPGQLSFKVAAVLDLDPAAKRGLLTLRSTSNRLQQLTTLLRSAARDAERRAAGHRRARGNGRGRMRPHSGLSP